MAVLPIITAPDKRLKQKSEPVESVALGGSRAQPQAAAL